MNDREKREDESLKKCIQEAYGCTDEQLMDELNEIEESLSDSDFPGVEDRILSRLMERMKETAPEELEDRNTSVEDETAAAAEPVNTVYEEKKVVRIGKRKIFMVAALAAAFAGTVGVTAIGGKSYFFKDRNKVTGVVFNSGKNISDVSNLEDAYKEIKNKFGSHIFALNYLPKGTQFVSLEFEGDDKATVRLKYNEDSIYFVQWKSGKEVSVNMNIDEGKEKYIENEWLNQKIIYTETPLKNDVSEFEAQVKYSDTIVWIFGKSNKHHFEKILKNIYFY